MSNRNLNLTLKFNADNKEFLGQVKASSSAVNQLGDKSRHTGSEFNNLAKTAFFKIVAIICLLIKQLLFLDLGGLHQLV
ncbi:hypothetical protein, partial [Vibrio navarrensis]|uniref:hypothetical protein n=1 Tax=Vibrio navarrensis TaxID=29495 RepID=UPI00057DB24B